MKNSIPAVVLLGLLTTGAVMNNGESLDSSVLPSPIVQSVETQPEPVLDDRYLQALVVATNEMRKAREDINQGLSDIVAAVESNYVPPIQQPVIQPTVIPSIVNPVVDKPKDYDVRSNTSTLRSMRSGNCSNLVIKTEMVIKEPLPVMYTSNFPIQTRCSLPRFSSVSYYRPPLTPPAFGTFAGQ